MFCVLLVSQSLKEEGSPPIKGKRGKREERTRRRIPFPWKDELACLQSCFDAQLFFFILLCCLGAAADPWHSLVIENKHISPPLFPLIPLLKLHHLFSLARSRRVTSRKNAPLARNCARRAKKMRCGRGRTAKKPEEGSFSPR